MKPVPRPPGRPHPFCPLCNHKDAGRACAFHAARNGQELGAAFFTALRRKGALSLVDFLTWALSNVEEMIPDVVLDKLSELDGAVVEDEFARLLDQEGFDSDDLRRLSAVALSLALINEQQQEEDDGTNDAEEERYPTHDRSEHGRG